MGNVEFIELNRTFSQVYVTERGLFHDTGDETQDLPDDLQGGSLLKVDVVHAVQMANSNGELFIMHFDVPQAQNKEENKKPYVGKKTRTVDSGDNEIESGLVTADFISAGNEMKSLLDVGENT